jgi:hypothetical protein
LKTTSDTTQNIDGVNAHGIDHHRLHTQRSVSDRCRLGARTSVRRGTETPASPGAQRIPSSGAVSEAMTLPAEKWQ